MGRPRKLSEKPTRFSSSHEEELNADLSAYHTEIASLNMETARSVRFYQLLHKWFSDVQPRFVEDYLWGMEKSVKVKEKDFIIRGRIDALYGNAIIEFESDLKKKLGEAKRQLQSYACCLLSKREDREVSYLCIASDGILFYVYAPRWEHPEKPPATPEMIELRELDRIDFSKIEGHQAFLWLDRYFFRQSMLSPTTEEFVRDFGINSPAYIFAMKLLQTEWNRSGEKSEFKVIYENWDKYLRIAYGTSVADTELFLRHTYLASFAKLLAFMRLEDRNAVPSDSEIRDIFQGTYFQKRGIQNFLEEDFLSWVAREKVRDTLTHLSKRISTLLERYNLAEISEDVLKTLYQELVDPETRHDLGEYYTPDWLADRIVRHVLKENPAASVFDPSCGSGSFLYFAIRFKRESLGNSEKTLRHIRDNVIGIDIHPLAVIIAKTNYLLGLGDLVRKRLRDFYIPVYMADSLRIPEQPAQISTSEKVPSVEVELDNHKALIPEILIGSLASYDEAIETCHDFAREHVGSASTLESFRRFAGKRISEVRPEDDAVEVLYSVAEQIRLLMEHERNSIWCFILKNVYKPLILRKRFDWIIGNPPWLSFRYVERGDYQEFLRQKILHSYCLLGNGGGHLITHLELGTLFFCACLSEYGKPKSGQIAFVLPRSVFTADQHHNFRNTSFGKAIHQTGITEVWDLEEVTPLFNVPACVVFGKRPHFTRQPIPAEVISGHLPRRNASHDDAVKALAVRSSQLHVSRAGKRSFWSEGPHAQAISGSPYRSKFAEGATLVPRSCWFVEIQSRGQLGIDPSKPYVRTDPRATKEAKETYKDLIVEGNIEKEFLYATLLSTDLLPFGHLDFRPVVLPIKPTRDYSSVVTLKQAKENEYRHLSKWLETCEREWYTRRKEKARRESLLDWLDYRHKLTLQCHTAKYKVVYPMSATNLCAAVVEAKGIKKRVDGQTIHLQPFIADYVLFFYETENLQEAHYLSSILNSPTIDLMVKPMQSRGLWGPRHICMKVWELPIPAFEETKKTHRDLAEIGIACAEKVKAFLPELDTADITPGKIGRLRNQVREQLQTELADIDRLVKGIVKR